MATFTPGSIISEIRGSVGSQVYSRNAYGVYVKARVAPSNPNTVPQQDSRARMAAAVAAWQSLDDDNRLAYIAEARARSTQNRLGIRTRVTGYQLFLRQYISYVRAGLTPVPGIQPASLPDVMRPGLLDFSSSGLEFTNEFAVSAGDIKGFVFATPPRSASQVSFNPSTARLLQVINSNAGSNVVDFTSAYTTVFGAPDGFVGDRVSIAVTTVRPLSAEYTAQLWHTSIIAA